MSTPTPNDKLIVLERRKSVAELYLQRKTQWEIARQLSIGQATVSRDLVAIREEWKASMLANFDARKAEELARVDRIEREALDAWERSMRPAVKRRKKTKGAEFAGGDVQIPGETERTTERTYRDGDPRFLETASWCVEMRLRILDLMPKQKLPGSDPDNPLFMASYLTPEQRAGILGERMRNAAAGSAN